MSAPQFVLGVASSTGATTTLAVDLATGQVIGRGRARHACAHDPAEWWRSLNETLLQIDHADQASALSVAAQQHTMVVLSGTGAPLRPAAPWNDPACAGQAAALVDRFGAAQWARLTGGVPNVTTTAAKWLWLRENDPACAARAHAVCLPHDYLTARLTGRQTTDRGDASGTGWWTPDGYDARILNAIGLDPALLPTVIAPGAPVGEVVLRSPLRPGLPVAAGTGYAQATALGLGLGSGPAAGTPVIGLGRGGVAFAVTRGRPTDPTGAVTGYADALDGWLPLVRTENCVDTVDRVAALLGLHRTMVEPGGRAVLAPHPGDYHTPGTPVPKAALHNSDRATTAGQLLQAAYDGVVYRLLAAVPAVLRAGGESEHCDTPLVLIGPGAQEPAWRETVRRLSGGRVLVPSTTDFAALGAAAQAAALITGEAADAVARRWQTARGTLFEPVPRDDAAMGRIADRLRATDPPLATLEAACAHLI